MFLLLGLLILAHSSVAEAKLPECGPLVPVGKKCRGKIAEVRPTQPEVGWDEVRERSREYRALDAAALRKKVNSKVAPAVIGPDGGLYLVDHHHSLLALSQAGVETARFRIRTDHSSLGSGLPMSERMRLFWERMASSGQAWLRTEDGSVMDPLSPGFPRRLADCGNNSMRTVISLLGDEGLVPKSRAYYHEFRVALVFQNLGYDARKAALSEVVHEIATFLRSPEGSGLRESLRCGSLMAPIHGVEEF